MLGSVIPIRKVCKPIIFFRYACLLLCARVWKYWRATLVFRSNLAFAKFTKNEIRN
jgi:hypothetical protein